MNVRRQALSGLALKTYVYTLPAALRPVRLISVYQLAESQAAVH
ncbi:hypothetical protein Salpa_3358 [Sporomusa sp. KB1]|nr:hypothetical protein Salpa_3358 [Sporomusa sp. KB1]